MLHQKIKNVLSLFPIFQSLSNGKEISHGPVGIQQVGHRQYVGGLWEEIGRLQFDLLLREGLLPHHYYLDIACGSLRGGVHFIPYLERGHYLGLDKEEALIQAGIEQELGENLFQEKQPQFVISKDFEVEKFERQPDYVLAQSLFTHLPKDLIIKCLSKVRQVSKKETLFFATFFERATPVKNPSAPHDHKAFFYTKEEMEKFGQQSGWNMRYIGDWNHPKQQSLVCYHRK